jgi:hypothetical protein
MPPFGGIASIEEDQSVLPSRRQGRGLVIWKNGCRTIASEAKQSILGHHRYGLLRRFAPASLELAMREL